MIALINATRRLCKINVDGIRSELLRRHLQNCYTFLKKFICSFLLIGSSFFFAPMKSYFIDNTLLSYVPVDVFIDQSTLRGYIIANLYFVAGGCLSCLLTMFFSMIFAFCILNVSVHVDMINEDFTELDEMWRNKCSTSEKRRYAFLRNICMKIQDNNK